MSRLINSAQARETSSGVATTAGIDTTGANFLVAVTSNAQSAVPCVITDSKGNAWTSLTARAVTGQGRIQIHYALNATVGSGHTATATSASGVPAIEFAAFDAVLTSGAVDQENGATSTSANQLSTGSITPTTDGQLIITGFYSGATSIPASIATNGIFAQVNQLIQTAGVNYGCMMAYGVQGTAAAVAATWQQGASVSNAAVAIASFKTAAAAAGGVNRSLLPAGVSALG